HKAPARAGLAEAVRSLRQGQGGVAVRVNPGDEADIAAALAAGIDLLVYPKADSVAALDRLDAILQRLGSDVPVLATIESPAGIRASPPSMSAARIWRWRWAACPSQTYCACPNCWCITPRRPRENCRWACCARSPITPTRTPLQKRRARRGGTVSTAVPAS